MGPEPAIANLYLGYYQDTTDLYNSHAHQRGEVEIRAGHYHSLCQTRNVLKQCDAELLEKHREKQNDIINISSDSDDIITKNDNDDNCATFAVIDDRDTDWVRDLQNFFKRHITRGHYLH